MPLNASGIPKDVEIQKQLTSVHIDEWLKEDVFQLRWWLLIGLYLALVVIWWKMADKSRLRVICVYLALGFILAMGVHEYGEELTLWDYPTDVIPIFPPLSSINLIALPMIYSIVYQRYRTRKGFIVATLVITAVICLIVEPLLSWIGFFQLLKWRYIFSFPLYVVMAILIRGITNKIIRHQSKIQGIVR